jgi:hypothetical protein
MAFETERHNLTGTDELDPETEETEKDEDENEQDEPKYGIGVLAGLEWSPVPNAKLTDRQKNLIKDLIKKAAKRDYPARLIEVIQTWEAALFYRGFQFLLPQRGGGWIIPGESTGYGPSMQMDLALLPTNIYSARAQMIIAALTRTVPNARFGPMRGDSDAQITAAESAEKFTKVIGKNNDLIQIQTDAARYLWTDGRFAYWSRYVKDGQRFGWEEDDEPDDLVPENEPVDQQQTPIEGAAAAATPESAETAAEEEAASGETEIEKEAAAENEQESPAEEKAEEEEPVKRTPRGQEVRTAHGKLEIKLTPMMANELSEVDVLQYETEVDVSRARGMCPWIADDIKASTNAPAAAGEIARLARQNAKLGMQSTYITSDSVAADVTIQRSWIRPSYFMEMQGSNEAERDELIEMFPNGCYVMMIGEEFAFARNESMDDCWALGQAYSGDGQNRNAMGTSTLPVQKRLNNWLDLMNDIFVRTVPKKWMDSKAFAVDAIKQQTNVPGDIGSFKRQPGTPVAELIFVEPAVNPPANLADFIKEYSGPLAELLSGAYPALAGGDVGTADSGVAIATQRDSALGRLAPTWHSMKNAECTSMKQLVRWAAKCRDKSINERVPGGQTITLEINDLKANITVFAESDENFPETYTQRKNAFMQIFNESAKNPQLQEVLYNPANLELAQNMTGLSDLIIPQVISYKKQLGEIEVLVKSTPVPNPQLVQGMKKLAQMKEALTAAGGDLSQLDAAVQELQALPPEVCSMPIDAKREDNDTEAMTCWLWINGEEGRRAKRSNKEGYDNVCLHFDEHTAAAQAKAAAAGGPAKPPSTSINYKDVAMADKGASDQILQKAGITPSPGAEAPAPVPPGPGAKPPAAPIPASTPQGAGGVPKR